MKIKKIFILSLILIAIYSCASKPSRPSLYPNQAAKDRGNENSQKDIDECLKEANDYLQSPEGDKLQKSAHSSSVSTSLGFGFGGFGSGVGLGFGVGPRDSGSRLSGEEQIRRNFTNQCLVNKGYQVVGWEN